MAKAKFIGKTYGTGYNRDFVYLEYEYRGHTYEVYENRAKGNEPLAWQHRSEQARIDKLIEQKNSPVCGKENDVQEALDMFFEYLDS